MRAWPRPYPIRLWPHIVWSRTNKLRKSLRMKQRRPYANMRREGMTLCGFWTAGLCPYTTMDSLKTMSWKTGESANGDLARCSRKSERKRPRRCSCFSTVLSRKSIPHSWTMSCNTSETNSLIGGAVTFTIHRATGIHLWSEGDIEISSWFPSIAHLPSQALMVFLRISTMSRPTHQKDIVG